MKITTKLALLVWILHSHVFATYNHALIKRVLPVKENCDPRETSGDKVCVKGDWINATVADCERIGTLSTCTPMDYVSGYSIVEPAVSVNGNPGCISSSNKVLNCDERMDTRCVCSSRRYNPNKCKCQYWPSTDPSNKPCIGYYLGQDTGTSEWACCAQSSCCMSHTWQRTTDSEIKCNTNGMNIKLSARVKYYFNCGTCQHKWDCEMSCNKKGFKDGNWLDCFKDCCLKNSPQKKRQDTPHCGDSTCSNNETSSSCPVDCCHLVNSACIKYSNECTPSCCQSSKCCSGAMISAYYSPITIFFLMLTSIFTCTHV